MELFELIQRLNAAHGPSGDEGEVRQVLMDLAAPYVDEMQVDTLGNLILHRRGNGPRLLLAAHMDSIGFIVTHVEKEGFLRVGRLGGIAPHEALYTPVRFKNGVTGVIAKEEKAELKELKTDACYLDIGASNREQALSMVQVGDTAVYHSPALRHGDIIVSPYLDNRISCGVLLKVLEGIEGCVNDLYVVFTTQEEVGLRGAKTAAWAIAPDYAVVVDVTDVDDTPGSERCGTVQLGKGAAVKVMDRSVICHPQVVEGLSQLAQSHGIPAQRDIMVGGGTDAGAIHTSRMGVRTGGVSIPCRYIHTPVEMADLRDAQACVQLLTAFVQQPMEVL